jgi:hypothetical protein
MAKSPLFLRILDMNCLYLLRSLISIHEVFDYALRIIGGLFFIFLTLNITMAIANHIIIFILKIVKSEIKIDIDKPSRISKIISLNQKILIVSGVLGVIIYLIDVAIGLIFLLLDSII